VPDRAAQGQQLRALHGVLATSARRRMGTTRATLEAERRALETFRPGAYVVVQRETVGLLFDRATRALESRLAAGRAVVDRSGDRLPGLLRARTVAARAELIRSGTGLDALDPFATLARGYAIVRTHAGRVVVDSGQTAVGDPLEVRLAAGALDVSVEAVRDSEA
jgi:exodeoxyribonuclease VII large subunit